MKKRTKSRSTYSKKKESIDPTEDNIQSSEDVLLNWEKDFQGELTQMAPKGKPFDLRKVNANSPKRTSRGQARGR